MFKTRFRWTLFLPVLILTGLLLLPVIRSGFTETGLRWLYMLISAFGASFCLTPVFAWIAVKFDIVDRPDERKPHDKPTPLLGGGAVFGGLIAAVALNGICSPVICWILVATGLLFVVGILDDALEIPATFKIGVQMAAAVIAITGGVVLRVAPVYFGWAADAANIFLTIAWIIGITNAMNFFDGMDGLAAGLGAMIAFFLGFIAFQTMQPFLGWMAVALLGSCLGFLPYNLKGTGPASIFLGDAGSTVIGFVLACIAVYGDWATANPVAALISPLLIFWVLIFDMVHITIDRILTGKVSNFRQWLEYVGKDHLHHRLARVLGSAKKSVFFIYAMTACLGIGALVLRDAGVYEAALLVIQALILVGLISVLERHGSNGSKGENY